jgi:hypothetical protein
MWVSKRRAFQREGMAVVIHEREKVIEDKVTRKMGP